MNKAIAITAALLLTAGGTLWAAVSLPSSQTEGTTKPATEQRLPVDKNATPKTPEAETMRRRGHVCGHRFCGWHEHHHGHVWCDGHDHWYCSGHD